MRRPAVYQPIKLRVHRLIITVHRVAVFVHCIYSQTCLFYHLLLFTLLRHFPNRHMSLFMDCSEAGYYNMDMDLVKFIISLFKQYYPLKLGSIYVYEMPWVMNAGWSIIKSWLSPAARNKMRFIQKSSIEQYFKQNQLTTR